LPEVLSLPEVASEVVVYLQTELGIPFIDLQKIHLRHLLASPNTLRIATELVMSEGLFTKADLIKVIVSGGTVLTQTLSVLGPKITFFKTFFLPEFKKTTPLSRDRLLSTSFHRLSLRHELLLGLMKTGSIRQIRLSYLTLSRQRFVATFGKDVPRSREPYKMNLLLG